MKKSKGGLCSAGGEGVRGEGEGGGGEGRRDEGG